VPTNLGPVDVDAVLDRVRFRGLPARVLVCSILTLALDGLDIQVIGFVAPALAADFGVEREALAAVLAASLIGMTLGGLGVGPIGDRLGRRPALLISIVLFGASTLAGSTVSRLAELTFWRLLAGIGLGGALPNITALMVEFSPPRWRSQAVAAAIVGVPIGGMLGAAVAATLVPAFGWRSMFVLGGLMPLAWAVCLYYVLPESPRYLATRQDRWRELASILNRIDQSKPYSGSETFVLGSGGRVKGTGRLRNLFSPTLLRDTVAAWAIFATNIFAVYAFFNWAPVVLTALGLDLPTAVRGALVFNFAGILGALTLSWLISRFGSRLPLTAAALAATAALLYLAWLASAKGDTAPSLVPLMAGIAAAGFVINAIQVGMYAVVAHVYPTELRASGVGWALGVGRLGGIFSSFAGAFLLSSAAGEAGFFLGVAAALSGTTLAVLALTRHIPPIPSDPA
jgi:AAHS family 4-hydroxybenzoate transporter-like MFS transporter